MRRWYPVGVTLAAIAFAAWAYGRLPETIPIHWDAYGEVNGWGSRFSAGIGLPAMCALFCAFAFVLRHVDRLGENYSKFGGTFDLIMNAAVTTVAVLEVTILGSALGWPIPMARAGSATIGALFIVTGNVLPRVRSNSFIGIRTPSAFSSGAAWTRTQRFFGYGLVVAGLLFVASAAIPGLLGPRAGIIVTIVAVVGAVVYSAFTELTLD